MAQNINQNNPQQQKDFNDAINEYRSLLRSITDELGKQRSHVADANTEYRKLDSIAKQLQNTEEGINGLTSEQLDKLKAKYQLSLKEINNQAQQLLTQRGINNLTQTQLNYLKERGKLDSKSAALLQAYLDDLELEKSFLDTIEESTRKRIQYEEKIKSLTGATGAILDGMNGSMKALGLGAAAQYLQIDKAKQAMQEEADAIAKGEKAGGKLQVRMAGIKVLAEGLSEALFSVEAVIGFIVGQLVAGSQNIADFRKQTGMSYESAYKLNMEMKGIAAASGDNFITSEKLNKSYSLLTQQLGVSADILGGEALISATNLQERLGMSAEQTSKLTVFSRLQGKNTEQILANSTKVVGAFNQQNKTAINTKAVLEDVANVSNATYLNMGKSVEALTQAATKARSLGLSLQQVEQISESMLNFEDSIGKELEAQLLTGGQVNLAKAREYALTGDMKGLTEEIGKQEGILNAFKTKNVVAQKAAADALGITREELANMTMQQELNVLGAENFKKQYGESAYESLKARSAAEKFGDAVEKIKDLLGSVLQGFSPIIDALTFILDLPFVPYILAAVVAAKILGGTFKGMLSTIGSLGKGVGGLFSKKEDIASAVAGKGEAVTGGGTGSITDSIQKINPGKLLAGAAALAIAAGAMFILGKAMQQFQGIGMETYLGAGAALLGLTLALAGLSMLSGPVLVGAAALLVGAAAIFVLGKALQEVGKALPIMAEGIGMIFPMLTGLAQAIGPMLLLGPALFGIAAGLSAVSLAGLMALPAIGGLVLLSKAAPALVSLGIGGENKSAGEAKEKGEGGVDALIQKVDTLVTELTKGKPVQIMLDGKVAATAIVGGGGGAAKTQSSQR
jgi:hypothetical protein